jgi:hypothetical protein
MRRPLLALLLPVLLPACTWWSSRERVLVASEPPGAAIWVDGQSTGKTTPAAIDIGGHFGGDHVIELRKKGYRTVRRRAYQYTEGYTSRWIDGAYDETLPPLPIFWTTGDLLYASASNTLAKRAIGSSGQALVVSGGLPTWAAITSLGTVTTGVWQGTAVAAAYGGTGQTSYTTGDLLYASGASALSKLGVGATNQVLTVTGGAPAWAYPAIPQRSVSADTTFALTDGGGHVYHPSADTTPRTWTIPANASVAFPIGAAITIINDTSAGALTIAITSDTLVQAGTGSTGSRTLAANGDATLLKIGATRWRINGTGLT